jgi:hypothetical protein
MMELGLTKLLVGVAERLLGPLISAIKRPRLVISLDRVDEQGRATGRWVPWGLGGPMVYAYHLTVRNRGTEPAREVLVQLTAVKKLVNGTFQDRLSYQIPLQKAGKPPEDKGRELLAGGGEITWNLGFLLGHEVRFELAVTHPKPLDFEEIIIRANERLRAEDALLFVKRRFAWR